MKSAFTRSRTARSSRSASSWAPRILTGYPLPTFYEGLERSHSIKHKTKFASIYYSASNKFYPDGSGRACAEARTRKPELSLPKIRSARSDGAVPPRWEWRQWYRIVGSLDLAVHPCARISASAIDCNTLHRRKEFALGAPRRR